MSNRRSINFIQVLLLNDIPFCLVRLEAVSIGHADDLSTTVKNHQVLRLNIRGHSDGDGFHVKGIYFVQLGHTNHCGFVRFEFWPCC